MGYDGPGFCDWVEDYDQEQASSAEKASAVKKASTVD